MKQKIPWQQLNEDTLWELLKDIVTRDGTDYGMNEVSTEKKIQAAIRSLENGQGVLLWDSELASASLISQDLLATTLNLQE